MGDRLSPMYVATSFVKSNGVASECQAQKCRAARTFVASCASNFPYTSVAYPSTPAEAEWLKTWT